MNSLEKALAVIRKAEAALRQIAGEAATAGDYEATMRLAAWGQELARLVASGPAAAAPGPLRLAERTPPPEDPGRMHTSGLVVEQAVGADAPTRRADARKRVDTYPRFRRKGDQLIKVGWSKREKGEYQHKAPRPVLDAVVEALRVACRKGEPVAIPNLLPLRGNDDGGELPPYQVYACLAWLRTMGFIQQHGREGYTVAHPDALKEDVSAAWEALKQQRSA